MIEDTLETQTTGVLRNCGNCLFENFPADDARCVICGPDYANWMPITKPASDTEPAEAVKHDDGKPSWSMLPIESMNEVVRVYGIGEKKYGRYNWKKGMEWHRVFDAMMRHAWAWWGGERNDPVDGQHHLASVAWCALSLIWYELKGVGTDDRSYLHDNRE